MKLYGLIILLLLLCVVVFGFVGPTLISAANTEMCILGFAIVIGVLPVIYLIIKKNLKRIKTNEKI